MDLAELQARLDAFVAGSRSLPGTCCTRLLTRLRTLKHPEVE
jgi:hypothetical protein